MARPGNLPADRIQEELKTLCGWEVRDAKLHRTFRFDDFIEAWGFMSRCALVAQSMDHHPDWSNVYNTVQVDLSTHDSGGITSLDIELARKMSALA